jgi:hypothetical protein
MDSGQEIVGQTAGWRGTRKMPEYIIRSTRLAHCKRGPLVCEKCKEMDVARICLLDIDPPDLGMVQRRVIEVELGEERAWREFDIVRVFGSEQEAQEYASAHNIADVEL